MANTNRHPAYGTPAHHKLDGPGIIIALDDELGVFFQPDTPLPNPNNIPGIGIAYWAKPSQFLSPICQDYDQFLEEVSDRDYRNQEHYDRRSGSDYGF